jgi:hypothetical protein
MNTKRDYYELLSFEEKSKWEKEFKLQEEGGLNIERYLSNPCISFQQFLVQSFVFDTTLLGWDYWYNLSREDRTLPNWVDVYYNDVDITNENELIVKRDCRYFRLPLNTSDAIAEDLMLNNLITNFVIQKPNSNNIKFE